MRAAYAMASTEQNFSGALATWKGMSVWQDIAGHVKSSPRLPDINLSELQKTLDAQGIELVENQKESVVGRKALADRTKGVSCTCVVFSIHRPTARRVQENS